MTPVLIHIRPWDVDADAAIDIRVGDGPGAEVYGLGGFSGRRPSFGVPR